MPIKSAPPGRNDGGQSSPSVLITTTTRWITGARLAISLAEAGCRVSALCLSNDQPLLRTKAVDRVFAYNGFRPLASLRRAIANSKPDLIIPCDDHALKHLHELQGKTRDSAVKALIERSLGPPESYKIVSSRYDLLKLAIEEGIRVPETRLVRTQDDLTEWQRNQSFPVVLKADHTFAGCGVEIAASLEEARKSFDVLSKIYGTASVFKRLILNRDPFWIRPWWKRFRPAIIGQRYVPGTPANCAVACWRGQIEAYIGVEVLVTAGPTKPATVVRVTANPEMRAAAGKLASRLRMSGLFGLDFIIDQQGQPHLIEMNPRGAPPCHLRLGERGDIPAAITSRLSGRPVELGQAVTTKDLIAYYPDAWSSQSELLEECFHDIPQGEPLLVEDLGENPSKSLLMRTFRSVSSKLRQPV